MTPDFGLLFGAGIQWFKALPLTGQWKNFQPAITFGLMVGAGYLAFFLSLPDGTVLPGFRGFLSQGWPEVARIMAVTQGASLAANFGVGVLKLNPSHPLVPVTNQAVNPK